MNVVGEYIRANVNPDILVWARQTAGYSLDEAAQKIRTSIERIQAWESGNEKPTLRQLRIAGRVYRRPSALFYRHTIPEQPQTLPDFRLPSDSGDVIKPVLRFEIRRAFARRAIALEISEQLEEQPPQFVFEAEMSEPPESLARRIRELLQVTLKEQYSWYDHYEALRTWITAIEKVGVLVFQTGNVDINQMRGFSISQRPYPVVAINGKDSPRGRIFTLIHEFVHIALDKGGICDLHDNDLDFDNAIEIYCNRVAGEVLVPKEALLNESTVRQNYNSIWDDYEITQLSNRYMVSKEVILRRLLILDKTSKAEYLRKRNEFIEAYKQQKAGKTGYVPYFRKVLRHNGTAYTNLVLSAYYNEIISSRDLSNFLGGIKLEHIPAIEEALIRNVERGEEI
ncbi:MAG: ImmA/IrrE family metallo-endopeptidase [Candidatus Syntrophonatronum acetioxidans]|uniref:ImmA/IrrE family metallo-endopeptidase n=1 Tax=Candidatus Syntrophonatronum acetioxidans TaxID=1795816 RepID=A0A424YAG0_9FIRM|nr:MAG: ImmA/IrrE family metallo-endopeptidase [Candidatus Syntrophonatronum acetioxidans]